LYKREIRRGYLSLLFWANRTRKKGKKKQNDRWKIEKNYDIMGRQRKTER